MKIDLLRQFNVNFSFTFSFHHPGSDFRGYAIGEISKKDCFPVLI